MFWRLSGASAASPVDNILDKENYTLEELLDEDEIIQDCKAMNSRLINFLRQRNQVEQLIRYIMEPASEEAEKKRTFKLPFVACEIFTCDVDIILQTLLEDEELMNLLFSFLKRDRQHSTFLAGYFSKVVLCLMARRTTQLMSYVQGHRVIFHQLIDLIGITPMMEVLIRLIGADENMYSSYTDTMQWVDDSDVVDLIVDKFNSSDSPEVHANAAEVLCAITRYAPPGLAAKVCSPSFVGRLLQHALKDSRPKSVLIQSLTVCICLLDPKRILQSSYQSFRSQLSHGTVVIADPETVGCMLERLGYRTWADGSTSRSIACGLGIARSRAPAPCPPSGAHGDGGGQGDRNPLVRPREIERPLSVDPSCTGSGSARSGAQAVTRVERAWRWRRKGESTPWLGYLLKLLDVATIDMVLPTTYGCLKPPLGKDRLKIVEFVSILFTLGSEDAEMVLIHHGALRHCLDLFFEYPYNNFLHHQVESIIVSCLESKKDILVEHVLHECDIVGKILRAEKLPFLRIDNDKATVLAQGRAPPRIGNIGHLTRIANKLIQGANSCGIIQRHLQENSEWVDWHAKVLVKRNSVENVYKWACGRPSSFHSRARDSDDEDFRDRDYGGTALASNLSQTFQHNIYGSDDIEEAQGSLKRNNEDINFDDESTEGVVSSLPLNNDQHSSVFTNSNWFAFEDGRAVNDRSSGPLSSPSPNSDDADEVVVLDNDTFHSTGRLPFSNGSLNCHENSSQFVETVKPPEWKEPAESIYLHYPNTATTSQNVKLESNNHTKNGVFSVENAGTIYQEAEKTLSLRKMAINGSPQCNNMNPFANQTESSTTMSIIANYVD